MNAVRRLLAVAIAVVYLLYGLARGVFSDQALGASGKPLWVDVGLGMIFAITIYRWDERMLSELGAARYSDTLGAVFEVVGVIFGFCLLFIALTGLYLYDVPAGGGG